MPLAPIKIAVRCFVSICSIFLDWLPRVPQLYSDSPVDCPLGAPTFYQSDPTAHGISII